MEREKMDELQQAAKTALDAITDQLVELQCNLEMEKGDIGNLSWGNVGELNHITSQLEQVISFWNNDQE
jgi:hypothetical protein